MFIGNIKLIAPALYLAFAAAVVLILGVIAGRKPDKGLDHWLPTQYLAPALTFPGVVYALWAVLKSLAEAGETVDALVGSELVRVPAVALFVTRGGHAQLTVDPFGAIFTLIAFAGTLIVMLLSLDYFEARQPHKAEYYSLLMFAAAAVSFAAVASDLIAIYLSIELLSLASYVLASFVKTDRRSGEAGLKYFLYGAACSAVGLYGMSVLFGVTGGSTALSAIARGLTPSAVAGGAAWVGVVFTLVGFGFKLALVPFQFWAPDVYQGAPTPVTAFLSVVSKAAGLVVLVRFLVTAVFPLPPEHLSWYWILVVLTAAAMFFGNLVAIPQKNIKRMLAYSSIAQVGYLMIGVLSALHAFTGEGRLLPGLWNVPNALVRSAAGVVHRASWETPWDMQGVIVYLAAYLFMNLGAFAVAAGLGRRIRSDAIDDYAGMIHRCPFLAASLTVFLISLAGVPPTAGFVGKLFIFGGAIQAGRSHPELVVLAVLGIINSVISAYYYLNVVRVMFFAPANSRPSFKVSFVLNLVVAVCLVGTLGLVFAAGPVVDFISLAVCSLLD
ncbi:MAG: NADH-quinone oxidoreductase subunit N [Armatimonadota bacterium]|nr:NADH-quinone oxidoreductase subunit N [Armatimonadota bacterium]